MSSRTLRLAGISGAQGGGRIGPRSGRTASGESAAYAPGGRGPGRSGSASSAPSAAASTPQPQSIPQPVPISQPASAPAPTANGGVEPPPAPPQQPEAVSVALQDISTFEASLEHMSFDDAQSKIGAPWLRVNPKLKPFVLRAHCVPFAPSRLGVFLSPVPKAAPGGEVPRSLYKNINAKAEYLYLERRTTSNILVFMQHASSRHER